MSEGTIGTSFSDDGEKGQSRTALDEGDALDWLKPKSLVRPPNQCDVPDADLEEEVGRILTTINPRWAIDEVAFNYGRGVFVPKPKPNTGKAFLLYSYQGGAIRKDSDEAKAQIAAGYPTVHFDDSGPKRVKVKKSKDEEEEEEEPEPEKKGQAAPEGAGEEVQEEMGEEAKPEGDEVVADTGAGGDEKLLGEDIGEEGVVEEEEEAGGGMKVQSEEKIFIAPRVKKLANQFNFCERAALTYNNPTRPMDTQTIPPPRANYGNTALLSIIYDDYMEDWTRKEKEKEDEKPKRKKKKAQAKQKSEKEIHDEALAQRMREAWVLLERLVNQNVYDDIAMDYRYWDDPSDEFREGEGSLLPLWKFTYQRMRHHAAADLIWSPHYSDLFGVAYGALDFQNQLKDGSLCLYSIKNPAYPEYIVMTDSPVISLDINREIPYLICVGQYDGNVCVYNSQRARDKKYQYKSDSINAKHSGIVWEVKWGPRLIDGEPCFYSIGGDGKVIQWAVMPAELLATIVITLKCELSPIPGPDGTMLEVRSCGSCITFHPEKSDRFLVGTEDGLIHECSKSYARDFVRTIRAHHMPVYRIHFNLFNTSIYVSCSGDWRVKVWEEGREDPLFMFDLGSPVGDVKWAPYSSTVFAACTSDGKLFVFDLNVNKYKPICSQNVVSKKTKKLTRIDFNSQLPVILCGDNKGCCHVLKLSPNLRVMCKAPKKQQNLDQRTLQVMKLDKLLSLVRDPPFTPGTIEEKFEDE